MPAAKAKKAAPAKGNENVDPQHKPQSSNPRVAALTDHGEGVTPLHHAACRGHLEVTRVLLEHGASAAARAAREGLPRNSVCARWLRFLTDAFCGPTPRHCAADPAVRALLVEYERRQLCKRLLCCSTPIPLRHWRRECVSIHTIPSHTSRGLQRTRVFQPVAARPHRRETCETAVPWPPSTGRCAVFPRTAGCACARRRTTTRTLAAPPAHSSGGACAGAPPARCFEHPICRRPSHRCPRSLRALLAALSLTSAEQ